MSKKAKSKKVSQNDLRKMMNDMKSKRSTTSIEGKALVTNSDAYRKALRDQQRIEALKKGTGIPPEKHANHQELSNSSENNAKETNKRSLHENNDSTVKTFKEPLPKVAKVEEIPKKLGGLPLGDYGSSSDEEDEQPQQKKEEKEADAQDTEEVNPTSSLPEGFFDDPEVDAKIRGVETPSSAMDREWEDFQKEIQKETGQSEQIIDEGQEIEKVDREIEEINEQILHFSRVEKLNITHDEVKEKLKNREKKKPKSESLTKDDSGSDDESIDEDLLDWREKDSQF